MRRAKGGKVPKLRQLPGIRAIDEAIGRAVEMGRPVFCSHGMSDMRDATYGPQTIAGLGVLSYVAPKCANLGARLIVPCRNPEVWPVASDIVETAYKVAGKSDEFKLDDVKFLSPDQFGFSSNYLGLMVREKAGANIMIGAFWAESMQLAETGCRVGAMQISGTASQLQLPFFIVATDYCLIGEEIFAASAALTGDLSQIASIAGQDVGRMIGVVLMIIGAVLSSYVLQLLKW